MAKVVTVDLGSRELPEWWKERMALRHPSSSEDDDESGDETMTGDATFDDVVAAGPWLHFRPACDDFNAEQNAELQARYLDVVSAIVMQCVSACAAQLERLNRGAIFSEAANRTRCLARLRRDLGRQIEPRRIARDLERAMREQLAAAQRAMAEAAAAAKATAEAEAAAAGPSMRTVARGMLAAMRAAAGAPAEEAVQEEEEAEEAEEKKKEEEELTAAEKIQRAVRRGGWRNVLVGASGRQAAAAAAAAALSGDPHLVQLPRQHADIRNWVAERREAAVMAGDQARFPHGPNPPRHLWTQQADGEAFSFRRRRAADWGADPRAELGEGSPQALARAQKPSPRERSRAGPSPLAVARLQRARQGQRRPAFRQAPTKAAAAAATVTEDPPRWSGADSAPPSASPSSSSSDSGSDSDSSTAAAPPRYLPMRDAVADSILHEYPVPDSLRKVVRRRRRRRRRRDRRRRLVSESEKDEGQEEEEEDEDEDEHEASSKVLSDLFGTPMPRPHLTPPPAAARMLPKGKKPPREPPKPETPLPDADPWRPQFRMVSVDQRQSCNVLQAFVTEPEVPRRELEEAFDPTALLRPPLPALALGVDSPNAFELFDKTSSDRVQQQRSLAKLLDEIKGDLDVHREELLAPLDNHALVEAAFRDPLVRVVSASPAGEEQKPKPKPKPKPTPDPGEPGEPEPGEPEQQQDHGAATVAALLRDFATEPHKGEEALRRAFEKAHERAERAPPLVVAPGTDPVPAPLMKRLQAAWALLDLEPMARVEFCVRRAGAGAVGAPLAAMWEALAASEQARRSALSRMVDYARSMYATEGAELAGLAGELVARSEASRDAALAALQDHGEHVLVGAAGGLWVDQLRADCETAADAVEAGFGLGTALSGGSSNGSDGSDGSDGDDGGW